MESQTGARWGRVGWGGHYRGSATNCEIIYVKVKKGRNPNGRKHWAYTRQRGRPYQCLNRNRILSSVTKKINTKKYIPFQNTNSGLTAMPRASTFYFISFKTFMVFIRGVVHSLASVHPCFLLVEGFSSDPKGISDRVKRLFMGRIMTRGNIIKCIITLHHVLWEICGLWIQGIDVDWQEWHTLKVWTVMPPLSPLVIWWGRLSDLLSLWPLT